MEKNEYNKLYYQKNKEKLKKQTQEYRKNNKDRVVANKKKYYLKNKVRLSQKNKDWRTDKNRDDPDWRKRYYRSNKERINEIRKLYRERNKEKIKKQNRMNWEKHKDKYHKTNKRWCEENKYRHNHERYLFTDLYKMKKCSICNKIKPLTAYQIHKLHKDGFTSQCKECSKPLQKQKWERHKDKYNARQREYWWENREKLLVKKRAYSKSEKGRILDLKHKAKRKRKLGWNPRFYVEGFIVGEPVDLHHVDNEFFVELPRDVHQHFNHCSEELHRLQLVDVVHQLYPDIPKDRLF